MAAGYGAGPVVEAVDLEAKAGELVAVVGPNGSGKTTLLRALAGALPLESGDVRVAGEPLQGMAARERARRIAVVPPSAPFDFAFTVREVVEMGRTARMTQLGRASQADAAAVETALELTGTTALATQDSTTLSAGQAQLVVLARALAQEAPVLLLDEPTAHLDVTNQIEVMECVRRLVKDKPLAAVAVLHDLNLAATYADRVVLISKGRVRAQGAPALALTRATIAAAFGLDALVRRHPVSGALFIVPLSVSSGSPQAQGAPPRAGAVHLVCGGGTGAPLMHALTRAGFEVTVGVVNVLDTDFEVAEALGLRVVAEAPFSPISAAALEEARALAAAADAVVLSGVPVGRSNADNLELLEAARRAGRPVYLMAPDDPAGRDFAGGQADARLKALRLAGPEGAVRDCRAASDLIEALRHDLGARQAQPL